MPDLLAHVFRPARTAKAFWQALSLCLCLLAACQPAGAPPALIAPLPTPRILTVQVTPALRSFGNQFHTCADELPSTGLVISDTPASSLDIKQAAIALRWGMQSKPEGYAAELGQEALVIIVSKQNAKQSITLFDLQAIYQGKLRAWPGTSNEIHAWTYPSGDDAAQVFETAILAGSSISAGTVYTAPDPTAMLEAVSKDDQAFGYLPRRWLNDTVKALEISGIDPASLRQPVVALSNSEPNGPEKSWLLCLQQSLTE